MLNPIEQWQKPFPKQHLVTKNNNASIIEEQTSPIETNIEYEDIIVFSLKATIAAFHVDPKTFSQDQNRLSKYFEPHALSQIEQKLYAATGSGLLDHCIISQQSCDAITRAPIIIEKKLPHFIQLRLPMVLQNQKTIDVILSIQVGQTLRITDFSIEEII
jgi:hypothetical protein